MRDDLSEAIFPQCAACNSPMAKRACLNAKGVGSKDCPTISRCDVLARANQA